MAEQTITSTVIKVHGRGSLVVPYKQFDSEDVQIDISGNSYVFEVDGIPVPISEELVPDPDDALGQLIVLGRTLISQIKTEPCQFALIDTTDAADDIYQVVWSGTIVLTGYKGAPDSVEG